MKISFDKQKTAEAITSLAKNSAEISKKAVESTKNNIATMVEKQKSDSYIRRMKKYNPLFPDRFKSESFNLPNLIMIVDDAVRRGIDVCEGAIGWLGSDSGTEVLYLYDEAVSFSELTFIPSASCDAIYYVDNFDRTRFIRIDCIFSKAHEERLAELKHIAHALGAKRCTIEITESNVDKQARSFKIGIGEKGKGTSGSESTESNQSNTSSDQRSGRYEVEFEGGSKPKQPELKWFAHDDTVKRLIEMRCGKTNQIKSETFRLSGASSATMSQKTAYSIDAALGKLGSIKGAASMNAQAEKEHRSTLLFHVEF